MVMTEVREWSVAEAKAQLSELLHRVDAVGPQIITRRGQGVAVVVSLDEWHRKTSRTGSLAEFFARSPLAGSELEAPRGRAALREVEL
jgi:prevent-host-death family protein